MLIDYYRQSEPTKLYDGESPIFAGHEFALTIAKDSLTNEEKPLFNNTVIKGVLNKLPALHYTTKWGNSPAAKVTDVVKKITEHKYLKMFAENNSKYRPPIVTDGWTQQVPQSAEPLSYDLEFRAYPVEMFNTTPYSKIIDFLIAATTPKKYLISNSVDYIKDVAEQAYKNGKKVTDMLNELSHNFDSNGEFSKVSVIKKALDILAERDNKGENTSKTTDLSDKNEQALAEAIVKFITTITDLANMSENNTGGCPILNLFIPDLSNGGTLIIPWIITSWSFKPAINITSKNYPIYLDFKITVESQYALTAGSLLK
ncbi:MAG: hypothetical protein KIG63_07625 [Methanobrevibacter sp.]|nr:hypothetical protein [Methanobrevibacter sp.]